MFQAKFEYYAPTTVNEAVALLSQNKDAKLLAGGHSLLPLMKLRLAQPAALIDLGNIQELNGIREQGDWLAIGALTTHATVERAHLVQHDCPLLAEVAAQIGDWQVRNRGTIGGSLSHADPAADYPAAMLALGAEIDAVSPKGKRTIRADDFFQGLLTTVLIADEVLTEVRVPKMNGARGAYAKFPHPASHYAVVGVAVWLTMDGDQVADARVGVTGACEHAMRATKTEDALRGEELNAATIASAAALASDGMACLSDMFASADYRANLVRVHARRALERARQ